ncbi:hypothetical protein IWQ61_001247 [Dispira simplex]|nr:hypothetical protein IWQ61_001247 [Dispira simplex]
MSLSFVARRLPLRTGFLGAVCASSKAHGGWTMPPKQVDQVMQTGMRRDVTPRVGNFPPGRPFTTSAEAFNDGPAPHTLLDDFSRQSWVIQQETFSKLPAEVQDLVRNYPSVVSLPVQWGVQDAFGHLNNVAYFRFAESGRWDCLVRLGQFMDAEKFKSFLYGMGVGPIVKQVSCKYKQVVEYPDTLTVGTRFTTRGKDRVMMETIMVSHKTRKLAAVSQCEMVIYDYAKHQKCNTPDYLHFAMDKLAAHKWF